LVLLKSATTYRAAIALRAGRPPMPWHILCKRVTAGSALSEVILEMGEAPVATVQKVRHGS
jgi:hypothetical protein